MRETANEKASPAMPESYRAFVAAGKPKKFSYHARHKKGVILEDRPEAARHRRLAALKKGLK